MRLKLLSFVLFLSCMVSYAQPKVQGNQNFNPSINHEGQRDNNKVRSSEDLVEGNRAYEIIVEKVESANEVLSRDSLIRQLQDVREQQSRGVIADALGVALKTGYGTLTTQKVVNLTSNLINYTVDFLGTAIKNHKERFNNWYSTAKSYRTFSRTLSQQQMIGDFYALPSNKGAFDPENLAFNGIGCRSYFSTEGRNGIREKHDEYCYVFCSLRADSIGLQSIVNHSKFLLEIDSIYFRPNLCDIPSHNSRKVSRSTDFFEKQSNLRVALNAKIYSSWFNEAIMLQRDQLLGIFDITININESDCKTTDEGERVFTYSKREPSDTLKLSAISISGESFIVPRSFSMNANSENYSPVWGTGEYRVELTLSETSDLNKNYYYADEYKPNNNSRTNLGNSREVAFANIPGEKYYDKKIWQTEWVEMKRMKNAMPNGNDKSDTFLNGAWSTVVSTMKGSSWTTTFLSPLVTAVTAEEAKELNKFLGLDAAASTGTTAKGQSAAKQQIEINNGAQNGQPGIPGTGVLNSGNTGSMPQNNLVKQ